MNILTTVIIRLDMNGGAATTATLPRVFALLMADRIAAFTALRPHQRHAWHAFLVQVGAMALLRGGNTTPPEDEDEWAALLRGLTPEYPNDAPWCLIGPPDRAALLQPPLPDGIGALRNVISTPDELDMLVTSRNHDLKAKVMTDPGADEWLFALLSLQTMEGFLGAGNYGISRMNGGFANRPAIGVAPSGGPGAHVRRDIGRLLTVAGRPPPCPVYAEHGGVGLVWLRAWDGVTQLRRSELDPLYVEICRRVRLIERDGRITALAGNSKAPRIAATPGGVTGDPWTPIRNDKDGQKALTVDARGFGYRPMVELMFPAGGEVSFLQKAVDTDATEGLSLLARALVRGQGKTEGYHERRVPLSRKIKRQLGNPRLDPTDPAAEMAHARVKMVGEMSFSLRFALQALFQNGPDQIDLRHTASAKKAEIFVERFDRAVDQTFFDDFWREFDQDGATARHAVRTEWVWSLLRLAETVLDQADAAAARATRRRYRARIRAAGALHGTARRPTTAIGQIFEEAKDAA